MSAVRADSSFQLFLQLSRGLIAELIRHILQRLVYIAEVRLLLLVKEDF